MHTGTDGGCHTRSRHVATIIRASPVRLTKAADDRVDSLPMKRFCGTLILAVLGGSVTAPLESKAKAPDLAGVVKHADESLKALRDALSELRRVLQLADGIPDGLRASILAILQKADALENMAVDEIANLHEEAQAVLSRVLAELKRNGGLRDVSLAITKASDQLSEVVKTAQARVYRWEWVNPHSEKNPYVRIVGKDLYAGPTSYAIVEYGSTRRTVVTEAPSSHELTIPLDPTLVEAGSEIAVTLVHPRTPRSGRRRCSPSKVRARRCIAFTDRLDVPPESYEVVIEEQAKLRFRHQAVVSVVFTAENRGERTIAITKDNIIQVFLGEKKFLRDGMRYGNTTRNVPGKPKTADNSLSLNTKLESDWVPDSDPSSKLFPNQTSDDRRATLQKLLNSETSVRLKPLESDASCLGVWRKVDSLSYEVANCSNSYVQLTDKTSRGATFKITCPGDERRDCVTTGRGEFVFEGTSTVDHERQARDVLPFGGMVSLPYVPGAASELRLSEPDGNGKKWIVSEYDHGDGTPFFVTWSKSAKRVTVRSRHAVD